MAGCQTVVGHASGQRMGGKTSGLIGPGSGGRQGELPQPSDSALQGIRSTQIVYKHIMWYDRLPLLDLRHMYHMIRFTLFTPDIS